MIRRFALIFLLAVISMTLASSMDAGRRRSVGKGGTVVVPPPDKVVELVMPVLSYKDAATEEGTVILVLAESHFPAVAGTEYRDYVQKPGESQWTFLGSSVVPPHVAGMYGSGSLYQGAGFYDVLANDTKRYWVSGQAIFKREIRSVQGEITSVRTSVDVPSEGGRLPPSSSLNPIQRVVPASDGKSALLLGNFPSRPTLRWYREDKDVPGSFWRGRVEMSAESTITIPAEFAGSPAFLLACFGYPDAECWTTLVDLPVASND